MNIYRKRQDKIIIALILFIVGNFLFPIEGQAKENMLNFYVKPEFPASQLEGSNNYFDVNLAPGETEKLILTLQNDEEEDIQVNITPHTAYTNVQGVVEYGKDAENQDSTLVYSLMELIEPIEPITLAAKESEKVEITLNMPKESFKGILAGGLRIEKFKDKKEEDGKEEGIAINNEFSYIIGVIVSNSRSKIQTDLNLLDVYADQLNYRNVVSATIQNITSTFVNNLEIEATIQKVGEDKILYTMNREQMQMAPNSNFKFPISLQGDRFKSGEYTLNLIARSGEEEWVWKKNFSIKAEQAHELNLKDVTIDKSQNWWVIFLISIVILLLVLIFLFVIKKKKE